MVEVRILGTQDVRGPDGESLLSVLVHPKRFAVLSYLCLTAWGAYVSRDRLLGVFWAESDESRARNALSQILHWLRRSLGSDVFLTRGAQDVGLSADHLWCDAAAFGHAVEGGRNGEALDLYAGELLEGFHLGGSQEFDAWLSQERRRLRELAAGAAWTVAHDLLTEGRLGDAERTAQRATVLSGAAEGEARRFIRALASAGDRAAAVRFYDRFAEGLAIEMELRPNAETRMLVDDIRASKGCGEAAALAGLTGGARTQSASVLDRLRASLANRYFIEREIGRGGMATVYVGHDLKHDRTVAFKVLDPDLAATVGTDRFLHEIKTAARLAHPHILPLIDSGRAGDLLYYVMPHVEGESLRARLNREGRLPVDEAVRIAREIADALVYAHEQNVLHRDVKPSNILLEAGHAVLADFGVARALAEADEDRTTQTDGGGLAPTGRTDLTRTGTPAYMSPEQASGERVLSGASDQYALACVTYEMLTGEPPVADDSVSLVVEKKRRAEFRSLEEVRPELPPEIGTAVMRALATDPADRFTSAGEFANALSTATGLTERPGSKRRWLRWTGTAAVAGVIVLAWCVGGGRSSAPGIDGGGESSANRIVVLPFTVRGSEELSYLEAGMAQLLAIALGGAGELSIVDPRMVLGFLQREPPPGPLDPEMGREIAARLGAGSFILGDVLAAGGRISVRASLYGAAGEPETTADAMVGEEEQIPELVDEVARQLVVNSAEGEGDQITRVGAVTTRSLTALKAYLRGEALFSSGFLDDAGARSAAAEYRLAVDTDSTFALAYFRMILLNSYAPGGVFMGDAPERARRFSDKLPPLEQRLLACYLAALRDEREAERLCARAGDPNSPDALFFLGDALQHYGLRRGRTIAEVREVYDRALELEPSHLYPMLLNHRGWIARVEEDFDTWAEYQELWAHLNWPSPAARQYQLVVDAWRGEEGALEQLITATENGGVGEGILAMETWPLENRPATIRLLRAMTAPGHPRARRATGHVLIAQEELAAGRLSAARTELAEARSLDPEGSMVSRAYLLLSPYLEVTNRDLSLVRDEVAGWSPAEPQNCVWRLYLLALLDERLDDPTGAEQYASDLQAYSTELNTEDVAGAAALAEDLALYLRARLAFREGRYEEAWGLLQDTEPERWWQAMSLLGAHLKQLYERWLAAEVLVALGRPAEALNSFAGFGMESGERSYMGIRHYRMAQIFQELGDREMARHHYGRFITYWKDADPALQPRVEEARRRMEALSAKQ